MQVITLKAFIDGEHKGNVTKAAEALRIDRSHCSRLYKRGEEVLLHKGELYPKMKKRGAKCRSK